MSKLFALILAFAMLSQSLSVVLVTAGFYANRDFIAKNQCENRFIPDSPCKGQCVLMKKLKDQQEKEQQQPELKLKEIILFSQVSENVDAGVRTGFDHIVRYHPQPEAHYLFQMAQTIFHPPLS